MVHPLQHQWPAFVAGLQTTSVTRHRAKTQPPRREVKRNNLSYGQGVKPMTNPTDDTQAVGYKHPPKSARFAKGKSGNPKGRPKGKRHIIPFEAVLGRMVPITENGEERMVTAADAFLLHLAKQGLKGQAAEARHALSAIYEGKIRQGGKPANQIERMVLRFLVPGNPNSAMFNLRMARKLDPLRATNRTVLEPWLVEAALSRLGERQLSAADQEIVVGATRTAHKVRWPVWWVFKPWL